MPEFVKLVEIALGVGKDMHHHIAVIVEHPAGVTVALLVQSPHAALFQ